MKMATLVLWMVKMMVMFFLVGCYKLVVLDHCHWTLVRDPISMRGNLVTLRRKKIMEIDNTE